MTCLYNDEHLTVEEGVLQLHVKHKCGTSHAYIVRFLVSDEMELADQLNADLAVLIRMMSDRAHHGVFEVNGRKYFAVEVADLAEPGLRYLAKDMPALVLAPVVKATPVCALKELPPEYQAEAEKIVEARQSEPEADEHLNLATPEEAAALLANGDKKPEEDDLRPEYDLSQLKPVPEDKRRNRHKK